MSDDVRPKEPPVPALRLGAASGRSRRNVRFADTLSTVTSPEYAPPSEHRSPGQASASGSVPLPGRAELRNFLDHAQRVRGDLIRIAEVEQAERYRLAALGIQPDLSTTDEAFAALCCSCGQRTRARTCLCGADMTEALALWRAAMVVVPPPAAPPAPPPAPPAGLASTGVSDEPTTTTTTPPLAAASDGAFAVTADSATVVPPDAAVLEANLVAVVEAARSSGGAAPSVEEATERRAAEADALLAQLQAPLLPEGSSDCSVCLQPLRAFDATAADGSALPEASDLLVALPCKHSFHRACIRSWWVNTAPSPQCALCKGVVSLEGLQREWRSYIAVAPSSDTSI